jgi:hypothetical protein
MTMDPKRKRKKEADEAYRRFQIEADERLRRLRELVAKGLAELEEKRAQDARRASS